MSIVPAFWNPMTHAFIKHGVSSGNTGKESLKAPPCEEFIIWRVMRHEETI